MVPSCRRLKGLRYLVVVDLNALKLQLGGSIVVASRLDAMLVGNDFPELKMEISNLISFFGGDGGGGGRIAER